MKSLKKIGAALLAVAMLASATSAFACANDKFIAYDQIPNGDGLYNKLWKCPEQGKIVAKGAAEKVEWKHAFYEAEYPHKAVDQLWLDDTATGLTKYTGETAPVNTIERPDFWECKAPYVVYNKLYSDFTGTFQPTNVLKTDYATAPVAKDWVYKGFDQYVKEADGTVADYSHVYGLYGDKIDFEWNQIKDLEKVYWEKVLANQNAFLKGEAKDAYAVFEEEIKRVSWLELEGPDYGKGGTTKVVPFANIVNGSNAAWYDDLLVSNNYAPVNNNVTRFLGVNYENQTADIEWVTVGYEIVEPYRYYQVLSIDGVLMDGSEVEIRGYEEAVEKIVDVKEGGFADQIHLILKDTEEVGYDYDVDHSYVIAPLEAPEAYEHITEKKEIKVIEDYLRETVLAKQDISLPSTPEFELRLAKIEYQQGKTNLPYIWRYAGGYANPKVEWKTAFAEAAKPYEIYEEKFVNDIPTGEYRSTGRFADDMPTVSTELGQPRVLTVVLSDTAAASKLAWALEDAGYEFIVADTRVTVIVPAGLYPGYYDLTVGTIDEIVYSTVPSTEIITYVK